MHYARRRSGQLGSEGMIGLQAIQTRTVDAIQRARRARAVVDLRPLVVPRNPHHQAAVTENTQAEVRAHGQGPLRDPGWRAERQYPGPQDGCSPSQDRSVVATL